MTTTIKVHERTKALLDRQRAPKETYDQAIDRLVRAEASLRWQLIAGYKRAALRHDPGIRAWEQVSAEWPEF